jgi:hypothetical protein
MFCDECGAKIEETEAKIEETTRGLPDEVVYATLNQVEVQCICGTLNPVNLHKCQKCGALMPFPNGVILKSRYKIQDCLGTGKIKAFYQVVDLETAFYQVEDLETHLAFAIEEYAGKEHVNEFLYSASCRLKLHHESIEEAFEIFTQAGCYFLVQEFIQGNTLDKILDESLEPLPEPKVVEWAVEICDALEYIHKNFFFAKG